jgi:hypothetical protein
MTTSDGRRLRLTVGDTSLEDVGEGRARISRHLMDALDLDDGEMLRVHGGATPILVPVAASAPADEGLDIIRLGASERRKAGVEIGDVVEAERHEIPAATRVRVVLVGHSTKELTADDLRPKLAAQPIVAGDALSVAPSESSFDAQVSVLGLTVAEVVGSSTECGALLARIVGTEPTGVVRVTDATEIDMQSGGDDAASPGDSSGNPDIGL